MPGTDGSPMGTIGLVLVTRTTSVCASTWVRLLGRSACEPAPGDDGSRMDDRPETYQIASTHSGWSMNGLRLPW